VSDSMGAYRPPLAESVALANHTPSDWSPTSSGPHGEVPESLDVVAPRDYDTGIYGDNWPYIGHAENSRPSPAAILSAVMAGLVLAIFIIAVIR
jgi:hypothetical protein